MSKIYFASDLHLGAPSPEESKKRERRFVDWLEMAAGDATEIHLLGDVFDFGLSTEIAFQKVEQESWEL